MTTLIMALISAGAGVLGNGPDLLWLYSGGLLRPPEPDLTPSCPQLGETSLSAPAAAAKCVYSSTASNIHQMPSFTVCDVRQSAFHRLSTDA